MQRILFITFLICTLWANVHAQREVRYPPLINTVEKEDMKLLNSAEYIFEGEILSSKCYYNADSSEIFTWWKVNVTSIYKGLNLKEGTIEFIREGGRMGLDDRVDIHASAHFSYGTKYVFLCKKVTLPSQSKEFFDNTLKINLINESTGFLVFNKNVLGFAELFGLNGVYFKTQKDFEKVLKKVKGVKIPKKKVSAAPQ